MTALVDDLGVWVQLGSVQVGWDWLSFPILTSTGNNIFRLSTIGNIDKINTFFYIRVVYRNSGSSSVDSKWLRFYPNIDKQILELNTNQLFTFNNITREIQVRKSSKWYGYKIPITDEPYLLQLEEFIPFDDALQQSFYLPQIQQIVDQELEQLKTELTPQITASINATLTQETQNLQNQVNTVISLLGGVV